jgi:hypothetical protein
MDSPYADAVDISFVVEDYTSFKSDARVYTPIHACGGFRYVFVFFCFFALLFCCCRLCLFLSSSCPQVVHRFVRTVQSVCAALAHRFLVHIHIYIYICMRIYLESSRCLLQQLTCVGSHSPLAFSHWFGILCDASERALVTGGAFSSSRMGTASKTSCLCTSTLSARIPGAAAHALDRLPRRPRPSPPHKPPTPL